MKRTCPYCRLVDLTVSKGRSYHCLSKGVSFRFDGKQFRKVKA